MFSHIIIVNIIILVITSCFKVTLCNNHKAERVKRNMKYLAEENNYSIIKKLKKLTQHHNPCHPNFWFLTAPPAFWRI